MRLLSPGEVWLLTMLTRINFLSNSCWAFFFWLPLVVFFNEINEVENIIIEAFRFCLICLFDISAIH